VELVNVNKYNYHLHSNSFLNTLLRSYSNIFEVRESINPCEATLVDKAISFR